MYCLLLSQTIDFAIATKKVSKWLQIEAGFLTFFSFEIRFIGIEMAKQLSRISNFIEVHLRLKASLLSSFITRFMLGTTQWLHGVHQTAYLICFYQQTHHVGQLI